MRDAVEEYTSRDLATYTFYEVTPERAVCDQRTFDKLPEYSTSLPTGVCDGKVWKRRMYQLDEDGRVRWLPKWMLGEYVDRGEPDEVSIWWRELEVRA